MSKLKKFKYSFNYDARSYEGELESPMELSCYGGENERTLMRMLANKYGLPPEFARESRGRYNVIVHEIKEDRKPPQKNVSTNSSPNKNESEHEKIQRMQEEWRRKNQKEPIRQTPPEERIPYDKCDYCGDKYDSRTGASQHLRKDGKYRKYNYCSEYCGKTHQSEDGFTWVNSYGRTSQEQNEHDAEVERIRLERIKANRDEANKYWKNPDLLLALGAATAVAKINRLYEAGAMSEKRYIKLHAIVKKGVPLLKREDLPTPAHEKAQHRDKFTKVLYDKFMNDAAVFFKTKWALVAVVSILLIVGGYYWYSSRQQAKQEAIELSWELESIENKIIMEIDAGNFDIAMSLVGKLNHPSSLKMEEAEFDIWIGQPTYKQYWHEKKQYYKNKIQNAGFSNDGKYNSHKETEPEAVEEEWKEDDEASFVEKHSEEEDSYDKVVREAQETFHQNLVDEGYSEEEIKMLEKESGLW